MIQKVKGTQDFLNLTLFNFIVEQATAHCKLYNFNQIATPILEPTELFKRSLGNETDVVTKEMFFVTATGHKDADAICLRPEATASTVRAFIENHIQTVPWKVFSHGPIFRHERPQKGRYREFHQFNTEVIGAATAATDAQFIKMLDRLFQEKFKLDTYALLINYLGCAQDRVVFKEKLYAFLTSVEQEICNDCKVRKEKNILRVLDCKNETCQKIYHTVPTITDCLCNECALEWQRLQELLEILSVSYTVVPTLVRGLDYYDKTVFEFVSKQLGSQSTFCGGGRYNTLVKLLGGADVPAIGAAMGIERLLLLLEPIIDKLPIKPLSQLQVIVPMQSEQQNIALLLADELQAKGLTTEVLTEGDSMKSMMRKVNKFGAKYALIIGSEEQEKHSVMIKNMITGEQELVKQTDVVGFLKK